MQLVKPLPPIAELEKCFSYDPSTGDLRHKYRDSSYFKAQNVYSTWNKRYAESLIRTTDNNGYYVVYFLGERYAAHRLIWKLIHKKDPSYFIDHINGVRTDNRSTNLRACTWADNTRNTPARVNNTSGYKGVNWSRNRNKWFAKIQFNKKIYGCGFYKTAYEAHLAYEAKAKELFGEFAFNKETWKGENNAKT